MIIGSGIQHGGHSWGKDNPPDRRGIGPASWTAPARLPRFGSTARGSWQARARASQPMARGFSFFERKRRVKVSREVRFTPREGGEDYHAVIIFAEFVRTHNLAIRIPTSHHQVEK